MAHSVSEFQASSLSGKFIVIDGPDGAGKSTQIKLLAQRLRDGGLEVVETRDPGGTAIGDKVRAILLDRGNEEMAVACETMLYMASRAQLVQQVVRPALARGACVVCDRYVSSTIAYQGAGGADVEAIRRVAQVAIDGCWPDLTVILDLPHDEGLRRSSARHGGKIDRMEAKGLEFHRRVRELFLQQAQAQPERFAVIDASGSIEDVHPRLAEAVVSRFNTTSHR